ncbi:hypothetical protein EF36P3_00002 [Enterococcus phage EF36P3]|nr:hypothetical protein EF36P3_00002 [Enterococcus phage EF36P3]
MKFSMFVPAFVINSLIVGRFIFLSISSTLLISSAVPRTIAVLAFASEVLIPFVESLAICSNDLRPPPPSLSSLINPS